MKKDNKNGKEKDKTIYTKIALYIALVFFVLFLLIAILGAASIIDIETGAPLFYASMALFGISGIVFIIVMGKFGISRVLDAEDFAIPFTDYEQFKRYMTRAVKARGYRESSGKPNAEYDDVTIFIRKKYIRNVDCITLIHIPEFAEGDGADWMYSMIVRAVEEYNMYDTFNRVIIIVCVDRSTPEFEGYLHSEIKSQINNFYLPCGVSFDNRKMYMVRETEPKFPLQYLKMRKELCRIMGFDPKYKKKSN